MTIKDATGDAPRRFRAPGGLIGLVATVCLVEALVSANADRFRDWMGFTWNASARAATGSGVTNADVLIFGDSIVKEGVLPGVLRARLGARVYNLAVHGGSSPTSYHLLRRAIRAGARPTVVVVEFHPTLLAVAPRSTGTNCWGELLDPAEAFALGLRARDREFFVRFALARLFPSLRMREGVRAGVRAALAGTEGDDRRLCRALGRNFAVNDGARAQPVGAPRREAFDELWRRTDRGPWGPYPTNLAYLHDLVTLAEEAGATVVWLWPPATAEWEARRRAVEVKTRYEDVVRDVQKAHPALVVVDGRATGYGHSAFYDPTHFHVLGATALTESLAGVLRPYLKTSPSSPSPAWVALPRFRPPSSDLPLSEDVALSRSLLGTGEARVR